MASTSDQHLIHPGEHENETHEAHEAHEGHEGHGNSHNGHGRKLDLMLWSSVTAIVILYLLHWQLTNIVAGIPWVHVAAHSVFELMNTVWWGIVLGILMISILGRIPREFVMSALGTRTGAGGICRATIAGVLLDLCSHGVLMVASRLYERGASIGQVIAFLVSSPWNSLSLTLILFALIGVPWTSRLLCSR